MPTTTHDIAAKLVQQLEDGWNAADGRAYGSVFTEDADFVAIRGDHHHTRQAIAMGHQHLFDTIYKGSKVRYAVVASRSIADTVILAHIKSTLDTPTGPLAGVHHALATAVLVQTNHTWRVTAFHNTLQA
jgi:uncharacterized protein (TIGR02246 family)